MIREVNYNGTIIKYELQRKRVKNINLRIKPDCSVSVSASSRVSAKYLDDFVLRKADFILDALKKYETQKKFTPEPKFSEDEFVNFIFNKSEEVYSAFRTDYNIPKPQLKLRRMKSRWGSCNYVDCKITFNSNLIYCSTEQVYYVIVHEFAHLLVHNHSSGFYEIVGRYCPEYKRIRKEMNKIII